MPQIHPVPIRGKKCLRRFGSLFPNFFFLKFHLFLPLSRRFAFFAGQNALVDFAPSVPFVAGSKSAARLKLKLKT